MRNLAPTPGAPRADSTLVVIPRFAAIVLVSNRPCFFIALCPGPLPDPWRVDLGRLLGSIYPFKPSIAPCFVTPLSPLGTVPPLHDT